MKLTQVLSEAEIARLFEATRRTLEAWIERTRDEVGEGFPEKVTAFREGMAAHGRFGKPCPTCGAQNARGDGEAEAVNLSMATIAVLISAASVDATDWVRIETA